MKIKASAIDQCECISVQRKDKFITLTFAEEPTRREVVHKFHNFKIRLKRKYLTLNISQ